MSTPDRSVRHDPTNGADDDLLPPLGPWVDRREAQELRDALRDANEALSAIQGTVSWRVTRPLRAVRRATRRSPREDTPDPRRQRALASRLDVATRLLAAPAVRRDEAIEPPPLETVLDNLREVLGAFGGGVDAAAWLLLTAVDASYPAQRDVEHATQVLRTLGPAPFVAALERRIAATPIAEAASATLEVVADAVVVDVSQIVSSDLHTGIQRVARECVSHWLQADRPLRLCWYDEDAGVLRLLQRDEADRLRDWRDHLEEDARIGSRRPNASETILVPASCTLVLIELPRRDHSQALRGLVVSRVHRSLCLVCYDLIPFVAPESVKPRMVTAFAEYFALLKHADRVSAISRQSADDVRAFASTLEGQGLRGPEIAAHPLPTEAPAVEDPSPVAQAGRSRDPLVLVVGVHAPRKNHVAVLEAGERLWREGLRFELVFMGGSTWRAEGYFDTYVERLQAAGRAVRVERRVSENRLWTAYRDARFTVFPSLIEGFGLPVAESLAAGTPVITSNYGSMAEIAAGGGALTVDPRDVEELAMQMRRLLTDDALVDHLRTEARRRDLGNWNDYARGLWEFFTEESSAR